MKSSFQTILLIVFVAVFVTAVAIFSGLFSSNKSNTSTEPSGTVLIWGVLPSDQMQRYVGGFNAQGIGYTLIYVEHSPETFAQALTNALADEVPPDVVFVNSEIFSQFKNKIYLIPYTVYSERAYRDTNVDGAKIFLTEEGIVAIPLLVDPLVVYYNKDILAAGNFALPPRTWTDVSRAVNLFTKRDIRNNISQSTIALGETSNISHFRDILSAFFIQAGNPIIIDNLTTGIGEAVLASRGRDGVGSLADSISFYTAFSNPNNAIYSWNRALPESIDMFLSGKMAFYIGRASELFTIQARNPNLNFDVIELFQPDNLVRPLTFGSFIGAGVLKASTNLNTAYAYVASLSASKDTVDDLSKRFSLPPVRRDLLLVQQNNPYVSVFFKAALSAFAWPDPNMVGTEQVFRAMIQDINSGRSDIDTAINEANRNLQSNIR